MRRNQLTGDRIVRAASAALSAAGVVACANAALGQSYFDVNGAAAGSGASGGSYNWSSSVWNSNDDGTGATHGFGGGTAVFCAGNDASGASVILPSGGATVDGISFEEGQVAIVGSSGTLTLAGSSVHVAPVWCQIQRPIAGETALVKTGPGMLTLGGANTYTGGTTIVQGIIEVFGGASIPGTTSISAPGELRFINSNAQTFAGNVTGAGKLVKNVSGLLTLSGTNTMTGDLEAYGPIRLVGGNALSNTGRTRVYGSLDLNNTNESVAWLDGFGATSLGSGTLTVLAPTSGGLTETTYSGNISGTGSIVKSGPGTWASIGTNSYSGNTTVSGGILAIEASANLGSSTNTLILNGGTLRTDGAVTSTRKIQLGASGGTVNTNGFNSSFGPIDPGNFTKSGAGTLTVTKVDALNVSVTGGTLKVAANGTSAATSTMTTIATSAGAKLDLSNNKLIVRGVSGNAGTWDGGAYTGVTGLLQSGYGTGTWNGTSGIVTSQTNATTSVLTTLAVATAAETGYAGGTFGGVSVNANDVLVMYTWGGDADLNGQLNGDDYFLIDSNILAQVPGYHNGDFDYDGDIDGDDYFIIDSNLTFAQNSAPFPTGASGGGLSAVPEPAVGGVAVAALLLGRRRRIR